MLSLRSCLLLPPAEPHILVLGNFSKGAGLSLHTGLAGARTGLSSSACSALPLQYLLSPAPGSMGKSSPIPPRQGLHSLSHVCHHHGFLDWSQPGCSLQTGMEESATAQPTLTRHCHLAFARLQRYSQL